MSAYIVEDAHIDALLTYGLRGRKDRPVLAWRLPVMPRPTEYQKGEPWGPAAIAIHQELRCELKEETLDRVGQMLLDQNYASVNHRYDENAEPETYVFDRRKIFMGKALTAVECLKAIAGYEYQACEDPGWETSEAKAFCQALRMAAIHDLPGYDDAQWRIE